MQKGPRLRIALNAAKRSHISELEIHHICLDEFHILVSLFNLSLISRSSQVLPHIIEMIKSLRMPRI